MEDEDGDLYNSVFSARQHMLCALYASQSVGPSVRHTGESVKNG